MDWLSNLLRYGANLGAYGWLLLVLFGGVMEFLDNQYPKKEGKRPEGSDAAAVLFLGISFLALWWID